MNTLEAITKRKFVRFYNDMRVGQENLEIILKAIYAAPVAGGRHDAMAVTVIQKEEVIAEISDTLKMEMNLIFSLIHFRFYHDTSI